ncbi:MAG: hypothetical protein ACLQVI_30175 [Polyangiaceae bacterium]
MRARPVVLFAISAPLVCSLLLSLAATDCNHESAAGSSTDGSNDAGAPGASCGTLFGNPNAQTGLTAAQCQPECACGADVFVPPTYSAAFIQSLLDDWEIATPYAPLTSDPYDDASTPPDDPPEMVCAVLPQGTAAHAPQAYTLATYASEQAASEAGAHVTHFGHCGVCSTLANLAVYMRENDLTAPVRACGLASGGDGGDSADVACLEQLGFDLPCAQAWAYDTDNTRSVCLGTCLASLSDPYNLPDGALSPCIECDEVESGPIFKSVAGRTRRNSGLPNAICRPCSQVQPLVHDY